MPNLTLSFDTYDERQEMLDALHGTSYAAALQNIDGWLRDLAKHSSQTLVSIDDVRTRLRDETEGLPLEW